MQDQKQKNRCPDCGPNYVNHHMQTVAHALGFVVNPLVDRMDKIARRMMPHVPFWWGERMQYGVLQFLKGIKLLTVVEEIEHEVDSRAQVFWAEAKRRGIPMYKFALRWWPKIHGVFVAHVPQGVLVFDTLPRLGASASVEWMDDKGHLRQKLTAAGFPMARGGFAYSEKEALDIFHQIGGEVIVKPRTGSRSRHTTVHIESEEALLVAFRKAKQLSPWAIVEEQLRGFVFRVTLIGGKVVAVMRREPPHVFGDGTRTIRALVEEENKVPGRQGPVFHPLVFDDDAASELARQHLTPESVPEKGQFVALGQKVGRGSGGSTTDFTASVHPENIALFEKVGALLADPLVGIDFIVEDMSLPWHEQLPAGVIECNSLPFIDLHHYPLRGPVQNIAGVLWDYVLRHPKTIAKN